MDQLNRIRQIAIRLDVDRFVMAHGGLYLFGTFPRPHTERREGWSFTTNPGVRVDDLMRKATTDNAARVLSGRFVLRVEKSDRNPFAGRISLGRAPNNDLVIRHHSVSKLHAHFLVDGRMSQVGDAPMTLRITDVGSANGTLLNGEPLQADEVRATGSGDVLTFGEVTCDLLDAGALHERICSLIPPQELLDDPGSS